jgi:hypothetical protein
MGSSYTLAPELGVLAEVPIERSRKRGQGRQACGENKVLTLDALQDLRRRQRAIAGPQDQQRRLEVRHALYGPR